MAKEMMTNIFKALLHEDIRCPCGKKMKRWNYAHHCTFPKHKAWVSTMPTSHLWRAKTIDELEWVRKN
ncbi:hypothetical protein JG687_00007700 [Phytophthora cactorum]|uniref:Uncharacterized protein n=1 Tax=Phytophthora cactorum TaxID=29920 RepID=A0A8T1UG80_9STRA|nr:hypothetical protein JG687_00007700 [Phytophthora cactorum]